MYHLALDTDILRQDPQRRSAASRRLQQLVNEGHVRLHIPDIVRREFLTAVTAEYRATLKRAEDALRPVRGDFLATVRPDVLNSIRELRSAVAAKWRDDFDGWCRRLNIAVHPVPDDCLPRVIEAYFEGVSPFRTPKNRDDFPDALVCATVENISKMVDDLNFVTRDERLRKAVTRPTIRCFDSVDAFLVSTYQQLAGRNEARIFDLLFANVKLVEGETARRLRSYLTGLLVDTPRLPDDQGEIDSTDHVDVFVSLPATENLGGGYFRFPFVATADVQVTSDSGSYAIYGYNDELDDDDEEDSDNDGDGDDDDEDDEIDTLPAKVRLTGVVDIYVPVSAPAAEYIDNEQLRRAMHLATYELVDVEVDSVK